MDMIELTIYNTGAKIIIPLSRIICIVEKVGKGEHLSWVTVDRGSSYEDIMTRELYVDVLARLSEIKA